MSAIARGGLRPGSVYVLLGALAAVTSPHVQRLPLWVSAFVVAALGWRALLARRDAAAPPRWLLIALALAVSAAVIAGYGPMLGRDASVALLAVMTALKCLELRTLRDAQVCICLGYFLIITNFLYSQSMATALFMVLALAWLIAAAILLQDRTGAIGARHASVSAATMVLGGLPLMLVLFLLFPRVQGPLFGFPQATSKGVSGLSETMAPGDLSNLGLSDDIAFRVQFHTPAPPVSQLYWRGPVLWEFDGRTWRAGQRARSAGTLRYVGTTAPVSYTVTLEPHHTRWLFAVDLPATLPPGSVLTDDFQLLAVRPVDVRERYDMTSHVTYRTSEDESPETLKRALQLPRSYNPRTLELGRALRARSADPREIVSSALDVFRTQLFFYTLVPPELGRDSVDEFLFQTRRGFCEHYASAFVVLMRAAGVPARVVTGYQGGEMNPLGDYLVVRQSEAHAWAEVWLQDAGWVRVDPTAAVSPARIEVGIAAALPRGEPLPAAVRGDLALLNQMRFTLDLVTNSWNQWVLGYTPDRQRRLLNWTGMAQATPANMVAWMTAATALVTALLAAITLWRLRHPEEDGAQQAYRQFARKLMRRGLVRSPCEGPGDFLSRIVGHSPDLAPAATQITALYVGLRYGTEPATRLAELRRLVRTFSP